MANLKFGNTNIGKISIIEPQEIPIVEDVYPSGAWSRPAHWLDMPTIGSGEHKASFLWAIPSGGGLSNYVKLGCKGPDDPNQSNTNFRLTDFTIDWGDGTTESFNQHYGNSPVYGEHVYDYSQLNPSGEFEFRGMRYRQAVVTLDAGSSGIDELVWRTYTGLNRQGVALNILEYNINAPSGERVGVWWDEWDQRFPILERARIYAPKAKYLTSMFAYTERLKSVDITTSNELIGVNSMFYDSNLDYLPEFETSGVETCRNMFALFKNVKTFPSGIYDFRNVYYNAANSRWGGMQGMFSSSNFEEIHIDIPSGNGLNGQYVRNMFPYCYNLKRVTGNWDLSNVTNTYQMFFYCPKLISVPEMDLSSLTDSRFMFSECWSLKETPRLYLPNVVHCQQMFNGCHSLKSVYVEDLGSSGTQNGEMFNIFTSCFNLKKAEFKNEKPLYTSHSYGLRNLFSYCRNLEYVGYIDVSGVAGLNSLFYNCNNLKKMGGLNSPDGTNFNSMFSYCYNLTDVGNIDITARGTGNVQIQQMFIDCYHLNIPQLDFSRVYSSYLAFRGAGYRSQNKVNLDVDCSNMLYSYSNDINAGRMELGHIGEIGDLVIPSGAAIRNLFSSNKYLKTVPFVEAANCHDMSSMFNECWNLESGTLSGVTCNIGYHRTSLSSGAIEDIFNWLGTASATIDIRNTPGAPLLSSNTLAIATNKGWTVLT
jgi:hypothetical protein